MTILNQSCEHCGSPALHVRDSLIQFDCETWLGMGCSYECYRRQIKTIKAERDNMRAAVTLWIDEGNLHEDDCPCDDTCGCKVALAINAAFNYVNAPSSPR